MPVIALANHKGGVGKTAIAMGLAGAMARADRRVLLVDMDPQANLTRRLGVQLETEQPTISDAIRDRGEGVAAHAIVDCAWNDDTAERIDVIPSSFDLEARIAEAGTVGAAGRLQRVLRGVTDPYDWTIIDLPPSLGHLVVMSLVVADAVLVVTTPEYDAIDGAERVREFVTEYGPELGRPDLRIAGVVVNDVRPTGLHTHHLGGLIERFESLLWEPVIPQRTVLDEANDAGVPIHAWPGTAARELTDALAELAARLDKELRP